MVSFFKDNLRETVAVVGAGFVGLTTALVYAAHGYEVSCVDVDKGKIKKLSGGSTPFYEPCLEEELVKQLGTDRLRFTSSYKEAVLRSSIIIICVGTPQDENGDVDMRYVWSSLESVLKYAKDDLIVVIKSTVPLRTFDNATKLIKKIGKCKCHIAIMPEFLREGSAMSDSFCPNMVLIGARNKNVIKRLWKLNEFFGKEKILIVSPESAQLIKYANNAHGAMRIVFIDAIATLCEEYGADIDDVVRGLRFSKTINDYPFYPGLGYGGSCFPKDVKALSKLSRRCMEKDLFTEIDELNSRRPILVLDKIGSKIEGGWHGKKVAVLGLSFKPNTDDQRCAPAINVIKYLLSHGCAVVAYDPRVKEIADLAIAKNSNYTQIKTIDEAISGADVIMPLIEWLEITNYDFYNFQLPKSKNIYFADMRNQFDAVELRKAKYRYFGVGRS